MLKFDQYQLKRSRDEEENIPEFEAANFLESINYHAHKFLGAHQENEQVKFSIFAPDAHAVSLVGDFCNWNANSFPLKKHAQGFWSICLPQLSQASPYQFALHDKSGQIEYINDPFSFALSFKHRLASLYYPKNQFKWSDQQWIQEREHSELSTKAISIYSCDLKREYLNLTYQELAKELVSDAQKLSATHIELRSFFEELIEFDAQGLSQEDVFLFSPRMSMGSPDDFKCFIDYCHNNSLGVVLNMKDFVISALRNPSDNARKNYFLSALVYWLEDFHVDAFLFEGMGDINFRISDSKKIDFIQSLNETLHSRSKGVLSIVKDSSNLPYFTKPTYKNGLGFNMKVFEKFSQDCLEYFYGEEQDLNLLSFLSIDLFSQNHILQLDKNCKILKTSELSLVLALFFLFPGKKMFNEALDDINTELYDVLADLSKIYYDNELLAESDFSDSCFEWVNFKDEQLSFIRWSKKFETFIQTIFNFSKLSIDSYSLGVPKSGLYKTIYSSSSEQDLTGFYSSEKSSHSRPNSIVLDLEPLSVQVFQYIN